MTAVLCFVALTGVSIRPDVSVRNHKIRRIISQNLWKNLLAPALHDFAVFAKMRAKAKARRKSHALQLPRRTSLWLRP